MSTKQFAIRVQSTLKTLRRDAQVEYLNGLETQLEFIGDKEQELALIYRLRMQLAWGDIA